MIARQFSVSCDDEHVIQEKKRAALDLMMDAWFSGLEDGIDGEILAHAALFLAMSDMIDTYGENAVAELASRLPQRIHNGEFSVNRNMQ